MRSLEIQTENDICDTARELLNGGDTRMPVSVCFVCTGNTCRSPMAAAVLNAVGEGRYEARSAGLSAFPGDGIAENAALALQRAGLECPAENNYKAHRARRLTYADIAHFDKIVAMTSGHLMQLLSAFPQAADKLFVMPKDIPDPFMGSEAVYDICLERIRDGIAEMFK